MNTRLLRFLSASAGVFALASGLLAQTPAPDARPAFEVASIKRNVSASDNA